MKKSRYLLAFAVVQISMGLSGCAGYVPGEKARWDSEIREMCARDGGVTVYERVHLTREEFVRLGGIRRAVPVPLETAASSTDPYVRRISDTKLHEYSPEVIRSETQIIRTLDKKVLGRSIRYWRRGGDFPTGIAHDSSFICPEAVDLTSQIFVVEGGVQ